MNAVINFGKVSAGSLWNPQISLLRPAIGCWILVLLIAHSASVNAQAVPPPPVDTFSGKPRVVIISDIGNEPDDQMSFVRLLVYSNELDLEAMIASTSTWQKTKTQPETMHILIHAYGEIRKNLELHAKGWPRSKISTSALSPVSQPMAWQQRAKERVRRARTPC